MSLDATIWAWKTRQKQKVGGALKPLKKLVLLSLADRASETHECYPSIARLVDDTEMDRKTVLKIIDELIEDGFIIDTGKREGKTKQVKVYLLIGVKGRETVPTTVHFDTENGDLNSTNNGTVPTTEQFQQFHETVPTIPLNSPNVGTRNLPKNLSEESKNKKAWLSLKKLREEILLATDQETYEQIKNATWFDRELRAFELYNAAKNLCDELMHYHFADWLINACGKYQAREHTTFQNSGSQVRCSPSAPHQLSDKQVHSFAQKLSQHPEFASQFAAAGESYDQLAARIAVKLSDPVQAKQWEPYLKQVGFKGTLQGAA
ncbi:helix-turn-helix domain-containing protein [Acinetobacter baumannii]|uniref:helix-turn-helix domain-containing protein n=1 Tax=Acinetobacter baumannii TaxID=470 RepID=UPI0020C09954|nr:helix-turn-helix domain-containing protein [Acinetobacter baumannii]MCL6184289.1 helix-turn-helix domain-containing protein [Acinetobacter baumannii]MCL6191013.1 helix-turn-helix domain-containing protein [Acinetobacter baumannii]MDC4500991.1 helix-turn-helix domain-containing protein [Acinetobacter baumannii]MDC4727109.1 helix-turn-helix domain-containing protein [Acinetobacter baumannii]MDC5147183.1 helix-turn-helix domain-containing protein [Acinetobacter baumannii]